MLEIASSALATIYLCKRLDHSLLVDRIWHQTWGCWTRYGISVAFNYPNYLQLARAFNLWKHRIHQLGVTNFAVSERFMNPTMTFLTRPIVFRFSIKQFFYGGGWNKVAILTVWRFISAFKCMHQGWRKKLILRVEDMGGYSVTLCHTSWARKTWSQANNFTLADFYYHSQNILLCPQIQQQR